MGVRRRIGLYRYDHLSDSSFSTGILFPPFCLRAGRIGLAMRILACATLLSLLLIGCVESNPGPQHVCPVCALSFKTTKAYFDHMDVHLSVKNLGIVCSQRGCNAKLSTLASFQSHMSKFHARKESQIAGTVSIPDQEQGLSCPHSATGCKVKLSDVPQYRNHMADHLKEKEVKTFTCVLVKAKGEKCTTEIHSKAQFSVHMSRYHKDQVHLHLVQQESAADLQSYSDGNALSFHEGTSAEEQGIGFGDGNSFEDEDMEDSEDADPFPDAVIKDELGRFYLKLEAVHLLPTSTVQVIAEEIKLLSKVTHHKLKKALSEELRNLQLDDSQIKSVVSKTFKEDTVFNTHHKGSDVQQFGSDYLRLKYWRENFHFIEPEKVSVGPSDIGKQRFAYRVSIRETLQEVLKDQKVKDAVKQSFIRQKNALETESEVLRDFTDGSAFKSHAECHVGKPCIQLFLFQDAFDPNAFSTSNNKPLGFYFTLANLPKEIRSKLDLIFLAFMVLEKDLKNSEGEELAGEDRLQKCLKPMIDELADLHQNGIAIDGEIIPVCVMCLIGDALGQNHIGGYVRNFSSCQFSCRFCPISKIDFMSDPCVTEPLRTPEQYEEYSAIAKRRWCTIRRKALEDHKETIGHTQKRAGSTAPGKRNFVPLSATSKSALKTMTSVNFRGVKYRPSPFNREELNFHVAGRQPPCISHDLHEGIVKLILPRILKHFIEGKKWFDLPTLNRRITSFQYRGTDALDKPKPLKSLKSLSGHAVENWNMLRLLSFLIGDLIQDTDDPYWVMYMTLKEINDFVCAPEISKSQVEYLKNLIMLYLTMIKEYLPECLTPKHHYLCHYPELILLWGPLICMFTLRFESKHSFFKEVMRTCKNFINVLYTMARKYTCRSAFNGESELVPADIEHGFSFPVDRSSLSTEIVAILSTDTEELNKVTILGTKYDVGSYLLLDYEEGSGLQVGSIEKIFLRPCTNEIQFLLNVKTAYLHAAMGYYVIEQSIKKCILQSYQSLPSYYPLPAYDVNNRQCLSLKHSTPFMM